MEYLLQSDAKKWRHFDDLAPKSGAPRKYTEVQGRILCIDARMGCGHRVRIWRRTGREEGMVGEVVEEGVLECSIAQEYEKDFLCRNTMIGASMKRNNYSA